MNLKKIEQLICLIEKSSLLEFSYKDGKIEVFISRVGKNSSIIEVPKVNNATPILASHIQEEINNQEEDIENVFAPIVGTFYAAASLDAQPFVKVGDKVKTGQTVCILEAMKLMNEISSDFDGVIEEILVGNGQKVEFGQALFRIKTDN